jgi:hypothetical protein
LRLRFKPFHFEGDGLDPIGAAGNEIVFVLHPGGKITFEH